MAGVNDQGPAGQAIPDLPAGTSAIHDWLHNRRRRVDPARLIRHLAHTNMPPNPRAGDAVRGAIVKAAFVQV
jgi:hypothetical protein